MCAPNGIRTHDLLDSPAQILSALPMGFEPMISWMRTKYPRPLDDGSTPQTKFRKVKEPIRQLTG